eukprot:scaffold115517_cov31-Tisochrysis_lutea.AAC.1
MGSNRLIFSRALRGYTVGLLGWLRECLNRRVFGMECSWRTNPMRHSDHYTDKISAHTSVVAARSSIDLAHLERPLSCAYASLEPERISAPLFAASACARCRASQLAS